MLRGFQENGHFKVAVCLLRVVNFRDRSASQRTPEEDTRLRNTGTTISSSCCVDRLNPQSTSDGTLEGWSFACIAPDFRTRMPGLAERIAVSNADPTARTWIGRTPFGTNQLIGPRSRAAHTPPLRAGWPNADRSPSSSEGCAITTDS